MISLCVFLSFNAALLHLRSLSRRGHFVLQSVSQKVTQFKTPHGGGRAEWPVLPERPTPRTGMSTPVAPSLARRQGDLHERAVLVRRLGAAAPQSARPDSRGAGRADRLRSDDHPSH